MTMPAEALRTLLDGEHAEIRATVRERLSRAGNATAVDLPREEHRARVLAWAQELAADERCEQPEPRGVLDRLCSLYALSRVEPERGWYQEHGRLTAAHPKAVIKTVNTLCGERRDHAELLVDGFGVPAPALADAQPVAQVLDRVA